MTETTNIFVYGSLREGLGLHDFIRHCPRIGGVKLSKPIYTLVDLGPFPGLLRTGTTSIAGEVYAVDSFTQTRLDRIERSYDRLAIELEDGTIAQAYFLQERGQQFPSTDFVASGDWVHYYAQKRKQKENRWWALGEFGTKG